MNRLQWQRFVVLAVHIAAFACLSVAAFRLNANDLFLGLDGSYMLSITKHQFAWLSMSAGYFANYFQALGSMWFPINTWLLPEYLLPHLILGGGSEMWPDFRVASLTIVSCELFISVLVLARALGMSLVTSLLAAWMAPLLSMPFFGAALVYPISQLVPHFIAASSEACLILAAGATLGRGSSGRASAIKNAVLFAAILALSAHLISSQPATQILFLPLIAFGVVGLIGGVGRREAISKGICVVAVVAVLALIGYATFVLGVFTYSAPYFWSTKLESGLMTWYYVSIFFHQGVPGWWGPFLFLGGVFGLVHAAVGNDHRHRTFALAMMAFIAILAITGSVTVLVDFWRGPSPLYFELALWPVYAIFAARGGVALFVYLVQRRSELLTSGAIWAERTSSAAWMLPAVLLLTVSAVAMRGDLPVRAGYPLPPTRTSIVAFLEEQTALRPGEAFRGRVATMESLTEARSIGWLDIHGYKDGPRSMGIGNDHHTVGLWLFNIPTLFEYNPAMSPAFFYAVVSFFARPEDRQMRNVLVLRNPDSRLLGLFGVRFLIADAPLDTSLHLVLTERFPSGEVLYLYEIPGPNIGGLAPVEIVKVASFPEAIDELKSPTFDPKRRAVLIEDSSKRNLDDLRQASSSELIVKEEALVLRAKSAGKSLLVLPFEFSRCLSSRSLDPNVPAPELIRVDGLLIGVLFDRSVDTEIRYFTGPFNWQGSTCRLSDTADFKRLLNRR